MSSLCNLHLKELISHFEYQTKLLWLELEGLELFANYVHLPLNPSSPIWAYSVVAEVKRLILPGLRKIHYFSIFPRLILKMQCSLVSGI